MSSGKEYEPKSPEQSAEIALGAHERSRELQEELKRNAERYNDKEAHQAAEKARHEAIKEAAFSKEQGKERRSHQADRHNKSADHVITKNDRETGFEQTMREVRKELPRSNRWFSDLIHQPRIEHLSDSIGSSVARPSAILAGSLTAFVAVVTLYSYAKFAGFALQGSEMIVTFIIGWAVGLLFDAVKNLFTKNR